MNSLGSTIRLSAAVAVFFIIVFMMNATYNEMPSKTVAFSEEPQYGSPPPEKKKGRLDRLIDSTLDHANATVWALIQAAILVRYIKKRGND
jgi:hypothetical protein